MQMRQQRSPKISAKVLAQWQFVRILSWKIFCLLMFYSVSRKIQIIFSNSFQPKFLCARAYAITPLVNCYHYNNFYHRMKLWNLQTLRSLLWPYQSDTNPRWRHKGILCQKSADCPHRPLPSSGSSCTLHQHLLYDVIPIVSSVSLLEGKTANACSHYCHFDSRTIISPSVPRKAASLWEQSNVSPFTSIRLHVCQVSGSHPRMYFLTGVRAIIKVLGHQHQLFPGVSQVVTKCKTVHFQG